MLRNFLDGYVANKLCDLGIAPESGIARARRRKVERRRAQRIDDLMAWLRPSKKSAPLEQVQTNYERVNNATKQ